jgi:flagellar hook-basal body complex protein FliE
MNKIDASHLQSQMRALVQEMNAQKSAINTHSTQIKSGQEIGFGDVLKNSLAEINEQQQNASSLSTQFESGDVNVKLSDVMVAMQKAEVSLQAASQIRNKFIGAYQDIMNMPI